MTPAGSRLLVAAAAVAAGGLGLLLAYQVHRALNRICIVHARAFCRRNALQVRRSRAGPAFQSGTKTEFTVVELDCRDAQGRRRLVRVLAWVFGIREVLGNEAYPDSYDARWP